METGWKSFPSLLLLLPKPFHVCPDLAEAALNPEQAEPHGEGPEVGTGEGAVLPECHCHSQDTLLTFHLLALWEQGRVAPARNILLCFSIYLPKKAQIPFSTFNHSISREFPSEYTQPLIGSVSSSAGVNSENNGGTLSIN